MEVLKLILAVVFLRSNCCYASFKLAGPYEITIEDMTDCEHVGYGHFRHHLRVRKVNGTTRLLQGGIEYGVPLDENVSYVVKSAKWTAGGWGQNAFNKDGDDFCTFYFDSAFEIFEAFYTALGAAPKCPIPAGTYSMETGMELVFQKLKRFPSLLYGRYRGDLSLLKEEEVVGCLQITLSIDEIASDNWVG